MPEDLAKYSCTYIHSGAQATHDVTQKLYYERVYRSLGHGHGQPKIEQQFELFNKVRLNSFRLSRVMTHGLCCFKEWSKNK